MISIQNLKAALERLSYDRIFTAEERYELYEAVRDSINRVFLQNKYDTFSAMGVARRKLADRHKND